MRAIKLIFVVLLALAVLLGVAVFIFIRTFDPNSYREFLGKNVEDATGRKLVINGDLQFTVWPNIALSAEDLELGNPPGFDATPMLRAKSVEATIQLRPLLQGDVRINGVVLHSPEVYLVERPGGDPENNWADLQQRFSGADLQTGPQTKSEEGATAEGAPTSVQLDSIVIDNGQFSYTSGTAEQSLTAVDAEIEFVSDSTFDIGARGNWQTSGEQASSPFELQTGLTSLDNSLRLSSPSLTVRNLPTPLPSELSLTAVDMNWDESGGVVRELTGDLTQNAMPLALAVPRVEITADLNKASATDIALAIANSQLVLDLEASALLDAPVVRGQLETSGADTQALLNAFSVSLPETIPLTVLGPMDLALKFETQAAGALSITGARVALAELGLSGQGSADLGADRNATGEVELDTLNLRTLSARLPKMLPPDTFLLPVPGSPPPQLERLSSKFKWQPESGQKPARIAFSDTKFSALGITGTTTGESVGDVTSASLHFDEFALKQVLGYLIEPVATTDSAALSTALGSASIRLTSGSTRLDDLKITLDESNIRGWLNNKEGDVPSVDFDLAIDQLDATGYLPPDAETGTSNSEVRDLREVDANQALLGAMTLPTEVLRAYNLNGKLAIDNLQLFDLAVAGASLDLQLGDGVATLNNMSAQLYGGNFAGDFSFAQTNSSQPPVLAIKGSLQNIALDQLVLALADTASFAGIGAVQLDLSGSGSNVLEATQNSSGSMASMALNMTNGSFTGVNLGHSLCKLYNQLRSAPAPPDNPDESTSFESFSATAVVVGGEATTNDLALSNSYLTLTGAGRARLARQSIAYDLDVELTGPIDEPNCETLTPHIGSRIPVKLSGTFANPIVRPDFGKLAKREIRRRVEEKLTEKLFDIFGGKEREPEADTEPKLIP